MPSDFRPRTLLIIFPCVCSSYSINKLLTISLLLRATASICLVCYWSGGTSMPKERDRIKPLRESSGREGRGLSINCSYRVFKLHGSYYRPTKCYCTFWKFRLCSLWDFFGGGHLYFGGWHVLPEIYAYAFNIKYLKGYKSNERFHHHLSVPPWLARPH